MMCSWVQLSAACHVISLSSLSLWVVSSAVNTTVFISFTLIVCVWCSSATLSQTLRRTVAYLMFIYWQTVELVHVMHSTISPQCTYIHTYSVVDSVNAVVCSAPCGLRGCKNRPALFPGRMSYKATKPGLVLFYILACFNYIVAY